MWEPQPSGNLRVCPGLYRNYLKFKRIMYYCIQSVVRIKLTNLLDTHTLPFKELVKLLVSKYILICYF
jgi:hypothetical protein